MYNPPCCITSCNFFKTYYYGTLYIEVHTHTKWTNLLLLVFNLVLHWIMAILKYKFLEVKVWQACSSSPILYLFIHLHLQDLNCEISSIYKCSWNQFFIPVIWKYIISWEICDASKYLYIIFIHFVSIVAVSKSKCEILEKILNLV